MLKSIKEHFELDDEQVNRLITMEANEIKEKLSNKNIDYKRLKSALIPPQKNKSEIAFVFDRNQIKCNLYGDAVFKILLSLLCKQSIYSILVGDLLSFGLNQATIKEVLFDKLHIYNLTNFECSNQYYIIYINNLSNEQFSRILEGLKQLSFFIGFVDVTLQSPLKLLLSLSLVNLCIKYRNNIIIAHEDDRGDGENVNLVGYDFEENGFHIKSIPSSYYGLFLSYKIERGIADDDDIHFALNAISPNVKSLDELAIRVPYEKLRYLFFNDENKAKVFDQLGIRNYTVAELEDLIKNKINRGYFYCLDYLNEFKVAKFNMFIELDDAKGKRKKVLVSLKYIPDMKQLQLITMY